MTTRLQKVFSGKFLDTSIIIILVISNALAWLFFGLPKAPPHIVDGIRDPEVVALLEHIRSGDRSGEAWEVTMSELEAEQTITWYLNKYPQIPFAHPKVEITPDYIAGEGDAVIAGLAVHVGGKARIELKEGLPVVHIIELSIPIPAPIRRALEAEIERQLQRANLLPVRFTSAEWGDGVVTVHGIVR